MILELSFALVPRLLFGLIPGLPLGFNSRASSWLQLPGFPLASTPGLPLGPHPCNSLCLGREPKARVATLQFSTSRMAFVSGCAGFVTRSQVTG